MGFLNHSTNNIIIDAVLTEKGRELLSRNDGSFDISSFRFGDDEVDYSIITQYGTVIGKEKIEKNTPIFESLTSKDIALKYPLLNLSTSDNLKYMPKIVDVNSNTSYSVVSTVNNSEAIISLKTSITSANSSYALPQRLRDRAFYVAMNSRLLSINTTVTPNYRDDTIVYTLTNFTESTSPEFIGQKIITFKIKTSPGFTDDLYNLYGNPERSKIKTNIQVVGKQSGASILIPVEIKLNS